MKKNVMWVLCCIFVISFSQLVHANERQFNVENEERVGDLIHFDIKCDNGKAFKLTLDKNKIVNQDQICTQNISGTLGKDVNFVDSVNSLCSCS